MFSRIQDLDRYKTDLKRFSLAIDTVDGELKEEIKKLVADLVEAVEVFDNSIGQLGGGEAKQSHVDHVYAQQRVQDTKIAIEDWMAVNAPNIHVE